MAIINNVNEALHRIRVKLYPNYLPGLAGAYIARTDDEASLDIPAICASLKNRGGATAQYDDIVEHVRQFMDEAAYQICDGFSANLGYFSIHPKIGGAFSSASEGRAEAGHPISFAFRARQPLRDIAKHIEVYIEGLAHVQGYIDEVINVSDEAVNETLSPGGQFVLKGSKLKLAGPDPAAGVYFVPEAGGDPVKVTGRLAVNTPTQLVGIIPALSPGQWKARVVTQYTQASNVFLKAPRTIESAAVLIVAQPVK